jgi:hypothetical protein
MAQYSFAQIKLHPAFPFLDFRTEPTSFLMLELYWAELFREVVGEALEGWSVLADAEPDGNPILSVYNDGDGRALRVIQKVNDEGKAPLPERQGEGVYYPLQAWLNVASTPDGDAALNELVLFADASELAEAEARALIKLHCVEAAVESTLEAAIRAYEDRVGMPE